MLAYCVMSSHWHLVLWPQADGELSRFTAWLTLTHTQRWHAHRHSAGRGHLDQGRFKSFPVQDDEHFFTVCRYVERNALRANLVRRAEDWRWGSLHRWERGNTKEKSLLAAWPVRRVPNWVEDVNTPQTEAELSAPTALGQSRMPIRRELLVGPNGAALRAGKHASASRSSQKAEQRFLTPFILLLFYTLRKTSQKPFGASSLPPYDQGRSQRACERRPPWFCAEREAIAIIWSRRRELRPGCCFQLRIERQGKRRDFGVQAGKNNLTVE